MTNPVCEIVGDVTVLEETTPAVVHSDQIDLPSTVLTEIVIPAELTEDSETIPVVPENDHQNVPAELLDGLLIPGPKGEKGDPGRDGGTAYTSLHYTKKNCGSSSIMRLVVEIHGIEYEDGLYIQCQQMNRRKRVKRWIDGCRGYRSILKSGIGDAQYQYPEPPDWMPNEGSPIDQWPVTSDMFHVRNEGAGRWNGVEIDLQEWLLDFLKPTNETAPEDIAEEFADDYPSSLTGVSVSKRQWLHFRFVLKKADTTVAAQPVCTLVIGMKADGGSIKTVLPYELLGEPRPDLFYIEIR